MTKPAPAKPIRKRVRASISKERLKAKQTQRIPEIISSSENVTRGPNLSTKIPMIIRAGIVSATFRISRAFHCASLRSNAAVRAPLNGACANQRTKVRKNANHVVCRVRIEGALKSTRLRPPPLGE